MIMGLNRWKIAEPEWVPVHESSTGNGAACARRIARTGSPFTYL